MPKYLIVASLNVEGVKGVLDKGGVARRDAISKLIADAGGTLESFYFRSAGRTCMRPWTFRTTRRLLRSR